MKKELKVAITLLKVGLIRIGGTMSAEIFVKYAEYLMLGIFSIQFAYGLSILLLGNIMMNYYEWGTFRDPSKLFQKVVNFGTGLFMGSGYFVYKRLYKYNWFLRKLYFLIFLVGGGILSIIIYYILSFILHTIFRV
ncbi:hypothetical protein [Bacillus sp. HU-1818]|uniref:hypothetical protein n=1 Tax=Bacillus sp. HU-1818 TaxID=2704469 RepID=UPI001F5D2F09|nr:hypothetical protein [Bacillus sp. HU-1818]